MLFPTLAWVQVKSNADNGKLRPTKKATGKPLVLLCDNKMKNLNEKVIPEVEAKASFPQGS